MTTTREELLLPKTTQTPLDQETFASYKGAHLDNTEVYRQMTVEGGRRDANLAALRQGEDADFSAREDGDTLDSDVIARRLKHLEDWKRELIADKLTDPEIKQAYRWKVNEDIANLHMLESSLKGDMRNFRRWNEFIYGKPDEVIYRAALDWVAHDAEKLLADKDKQKPVHDAAQKVLDMLDGERGYRELLIPESDVFKAVHGAYMKKGGFYEQLHDGTEIPKTGKVANHIGDVALRHILRVNLDSHYELKDSSSKTWSVVHSNEALERPAEYDMVPQRFLGLTDHELKHLIERINGERGSIRLMSEGLDRTELNNEGSALVSEMVQYDSFDEFGKLVRWRDILRRDIAIGYGWGIGSDKPRTSKEVYAFMNVIDTMYQAKLTPNDSEQTADKAHKKTGDLVARVLRGVDGAQGGAYLKDKVYLEGNVATWLAAATRGPQAFLDTYRGKFDINNPRHITFLQHKGLLPKE